MIFGALLKKQSSPCQLAAPADPRDRDCPLRPATTGCPAWTARPPARRAASPPRTSTAVSAASPRDTGGDRLKDHYGSITSLASSTSMISPQELQNLIDEANQSLEESGTPSHEIMVIVLHREFSV